MNLTQYNLDFQYFIFYKQWFNVFTIFFNDQNQSSIVIIFLFDFCLSENLVADKRWNRYIISSLIFDVLLYV